VSQCARGSGSVSGGMACLVKVVRLFVLASPSNLDLTKDSAMSKSLVTRGFTHAHHAT